jgi:hypothetical protein
VFGTGPFVNDDTKAGFCIKIVKNVQNPVK